MIYAIVFDMDETLGFFQQINYLWHLFKGIYNNINNNLFKEILNLYPEYIRPNLLEILNFLKLKKQQNKCSNIIIYTNNKTSKEWVTLIQNYFNEILKYDLFDKIICAFKINDKIIETNRTSYNKKFDDLIRCSYLDPKTNICFIDDKFYPEMIKNNLVYIKLKKKYIFELDKEVIFKRLNESNIIKNNLPNNTILIVKNNYNYINKFNNDSIEIHEIVSKKIMYYLNKFLTNKKTLKRKFKQNNNNSNTKKIFKY